MSWGNDALKVYLKNPEAVITDEIAEVAKSLGKGGKNKYGAVRCEYDGTKFDSRKEMLRYFDLAILERAGRIRNLELQPEYELPAGVKYRGDFRYIENGETVVEDVKSEATAKNSTFRVKWKQVKELYPGIDFRLVE